MDLEEVLRIRSLSRILKEQYDSPAGSEPHLIVGKHDFFRSLNTMASSQTVALCRAVRAAAAALPKKERSPDRPNPGGPHRPSYGATDRPVHGVEVKAAPPAETSFRMHKTTQLGVASSAGEAPTDDAARGTGSGATDRGASPFWSRARTAMGPAARHAAAATSGYVDRTHAARAFGVALAAASAASAGQARSDIGVGMSRQKAPGCPWQPLPEGEEVAKQPAGAQLQHASTMPTSRSLDAPEDLPGDHWARNGRSRDAAIFREVVATDYALRTVFEGGKKSILATPNTCRDWSFDERGQATPELPGHHGTVGSRACRPMSAPLSRSSGSALPQAQAQPKNSSTLERSAAGNAGEGRAGADRDPRRQTTDDLYGITEEAESPALDTHLARAVSHLHLSSLPEHGGHISYSARPSSAPFASSMERAVPSSSTHAPKASAQGRPNSASLRRPGQPLAAGGNSAGPSVKVRSASALLPPPPRRNNGKNSSNSSNNSNNSNASDAAPRSLRAGNADITIGSAVRDLTGTAGSVSKAPLTSAGWPASTRQLVHSSTILTPRRDYAQPWSGSSSSSSSSAAARSQSSAVAELRSLDSVTVERLHPVGGMQALPATTCTPDAMLKTMLDVYEGFFAES